MAINLAEKYSGKLVEPFYLESVVAGKTSKEYEWDGVKTVKALTITTVAPGNYTRTGTARYGTPTEVEDTMQTMTITQDKSVALTIDKGNLKQQMLVKKAGRVLKAETREQFIPMFDKHCLTQWSKGTGIQSAVDAKVDKTNIVSIMSKGITALVNAKVPLTNCYFYVGATKYAELLQAPEFINLEKLGTKALENGVVGKLRNVQVVEVPDDYMPSTVNFMLVNKGSVLAPTQIKDAKIHQDPPGINGALLEARWLFDAFVLEGKAKGVYVSKTA